jgi:hypothetical protein
VSDIDGYILLEQLETPRHVYETVHSYLDERRLLATRLDIISPEYIPVAVSVQVKAENRSVHSEIEADVEARLCHYINPICGGIDGNGWPFGRSLSAPEIYAALQGIKGVDYIEEVTIFPVDINTGERQEAITRLAVPPNGLICSHKHEVTVVE